MSEGIRRWIFSAFGVLALCLLMTGLDARAGDRQAVRVSFSQAWLENLPFEQSPGSGHPCLQQGATMNRSALSERILEKLDAYFASCSENFVSEGQEFALEISPAPRADWYLAPSTATGIPVE